MDNESPQKRSILITGCSSGIGWYCALQLQKDGWQVYATARKSKDIKALKSHGVEAFFLDYSNNASIHAAFNEVMIKTGGRLDALFNNGAYGQAGAVEDLSTQTLRQQFEANFFGWHELTNLAVPVMRKQGHGRIVHCSSILGFVPLAWRGAYNASKYALEGLATTMRLELKGSSIEVCLIEPGPIKSKFIQNGLPHFINKIDQTNTVHEIQYKEQLQRLQTSGGKNRFRLGPEAVYSKLVHALTAKQPKAHYLVTLPTYMMAIARRILPYSMLERVLSRSN
jgi:NAD(P)-dependent dehydrogenase (short-subunit alcohol dehydrogenase family)